MRHLSAIILIVFLVILPSCKYFKGGGLFGRKADKAALLQVRQDSIRVADSIRKAQDELAAIENEKLASAKKAEEAQMAIDSKFRYNIIVGSFITHEYAIELEKVYRQNGYDPTILRMEGSRFELVSAEAYDNYGKAAERVKEFQESIELDAWLYIKK